MHPQIPPCCRHNCDIVGIQTTACTALALSVNWFENKWKGNLVDMLPCLFSRPKSVCWIHRFIVSQTIRHSNRSVDELISSILLYYLVILHDPKGTSRRLLFRLYKTPGGHCTQLLWMMAKWLPANMHEFVDSCPGWLSLPNFSRIFEFA